jgi:hypothetical protein
MSDDPQLQVQIVHPEGHVEPLVLRTLRSEPISGKPIKYRYIAEVDPPPRFVTARGEPARRVVALFYLLMRDHLPTGKVEQIMGQLRPQLRMYGSECVFGVATTQPPKILFSSPHIEAYANELARELLNMIPEPTGG